MKLDTILGLFLVLSMVNLIISRVKHNNEVKKKSENILAIELISMLIIEFLILIIIFFLEIWDNEKLVLLKNSSLD